MGTRDTPNGDTWASGPSRGRRGWGGAERALKTSGRKLPKSGDSDTKFRNLVGSPQIFNSEHVLIELCKHWKQRENFQSCKGKGPSHTTNATPHPGKMDVFVGVAAEASRAETGHTELGRPKRPLGFLRATAPVVLGRL